MSILENVVAALIVSLLGLLSWIAYKHNSVFRALSPKLSTYAFSLALASLAYDLGIYRALSTSGSAIGSLDMLLIPPWVILVLYSAFNIYLSVLDRVDEIFSRT
jgi:hypothetical protein